MLILVPSSYDLSCNSMAILRSTIEDVRSFGQSMGLAYTPCHEEFGQLKIFFDDIRKAATTVRSSCLPYTSPIF